MRDDPALETLFLPFTSGRLSWPAGEGLFLRARDGAALAPYKSDALICEQTSKPDTEALQRAGLRTHPHAAAPEGERDSESERQIEARAPYALVLVLPPRQREESRALLARAVSLATPHGQVVACAANNEGARSVEADLEQLTGSLDVATKNKCRVVWTAPLPVDRSALVSQWLGLDAVRPIADGRFVSRPGVFAWDRIDVASALLAEHLPADLKGRAADLGAGFGYLSVELLTRCPSVAALDVYEAEHRALDLARANLHAYESRVAIGYHWHDVTTGLPHLYDVIVTNPPFHTQQRTDRPDIGRRFITIAAQALQPGGRLWLVANRHLPYESVLNESFGRVRTVAQRHGFKVIEALKSNPHFSKGARRK